MRVQLSRQAEKALLKLQPKRAQAIVAALTKLAADPDRRDADVRPLTGVPGTYRLRVGQWRVIFRRAGEILDVDWIGPRGDAY